MSSPDPRVSTCRRCKHYVLQGRRGGHCHKLNVSVQGSWTPCSLAIPAFATPLELASHALNHLMVENSGSSQFHSEPTVRIEAFQNLPQQAIS
jgi:hypothetical protein